MIARSIQRVGPAILAIGLILTPSPRTRQRHHDAFGRQTYSAVDRLTDKIPDFVLPLPVDLYAVTADS